VVILMVTVGLRITASLPSELQSSWLFASIDPDPRRARAGVFRVLAGCLVAPVALAAAAFGWERMDPQAAVSFGLICFAAGLLVTEALLHTFSGMPCSRPWSAEALSLRKFWPFYLFFFLAFTRGVPWLARQVASDRTAIAVTLTVAAFAGIALRYYGRARRHDDDYEIDVLPHINVLHIE
jgi:hypothetical protein